MFCWKSFSKSRYSNINHDPTKKSEEQESELMPVLKQMHEDKSWRVRQAYTNQIVEILKVIFLLKFSFFGAFKMPER